jgi:hypothetical protein
VPGHQPVALVRGDPLQLADLPGAVRRGRPDPAAHRHLPVDVLGQVGRVEGEHEAAAGRHPDHETLVPRGVPGGAYRRHPGRDLGVAVGLPPVDPRVVEIHPEDAVLLGPGRAGQPVRQFGPLDVHRHPSGDVLQPTGVVVVQVADGDRADVSQVQPGRAQRGQQRLPRAGQHRLFHRAGVEPGPQRRVRDQRGIEPGIQQQPAAVAVQQHRGHRLAEHLPGRPVHRYRLRHVHPAQGERHDPANPQTHHFERSCRGTGPGNTVGWPTAQIAPRRSR